MTKKTTKHNIKNTIYHLVAKLFQRSSPIPSESPELEEASNRCDDEPMAVRAGWAVTFFGFHKVDPNRLNLRSRAQELVEEMQLTTDVTIVAALYIPGDGDYFGTVAQGAGHEEFASTTSSKAPKLRFGIEKRELTTNVSASHYHTEDVAMYSYESKNLWQGLRKDIRSAVSSSLLGEKKMDMTRQRRAPCNGTNATVAPNCLIVLDNLIVRY